MSAATIIAGAEVQTATGTKPATTPSVAITPSFDGIVLAYLLGSWTGSGQVSVMTNPMTGYTTLIGKQYSRCTYTIGSQVCTTSGAQTAAGTYAANGPWNAAQVALQTASTSPIQSKWAGSYGASFATAPTTGSLVLMFAHSESFGAGGVSAGAGWTTLANVWQPYGGNFVNAAIFAREVAPGETNFYQFVPGGGYSTARSIFLLEWDPAGPASPPPTADFSGTPLTGPAPLSVAFTDLSTNTPTSWAWDFGDGNTDTVQNPSNVYAADGVYDVELTATNADGSDTETKLAYVTVASPAPGVILDPPAADPIPIDQYIVSWTITRGASAEITGGAQPGTAVVVVKNTGDIFNPENLSSPLIDYLHDGTAIWIGVNSDGKLSGTDPRGLFGGRITDITPLPAGGAVTAPFVEIVCEDALGWMNRVPVTFAYEAGRSQHDLRAAILAVAGESRTDLAHEITTMPLSAADGRSALALLEELNKSNGTRHYAKPENDSADWYTYVTRNRQYRLDGTVDYTLSQEDDHVTDSSGWRLSADTVTNQQRASSTPVKFTPETFTVWQADPLPLQVTYTRPLDVWIDFDDYVSAPVVNAAYTGGTPTITLDSFGARAHLRINATVRTDFTHLTIEGALARRLPPESWVADDLTSQAIPRGVRSGSEISGDYVGTIAAARGIAEHIVWRYAQPQVRPTLKVVNWFPYMFEVQIGDTISYTSPQLGVTDRIFEVVGYTLEGDIAADDTQSHTLTPVLQECRVQSDPGWFVLDDSLLDGTDVLAY